MPVTLLPSSGGMWSLLRLPASVNDNVRVTYAYPSISDMTLRRRKRRFGPESDLSRCSKTLIVGFLPGFRSTKSGLLAACSAGYAALFAAATLAPTTRALNSSTVITSAVENASIVNVARWTSAADSAP